MYPKVSVALSKSLLSITLRVLLEALNVIDTARLEGHAEGIEAGRQAERFARARQMKQDGVSATRIAQYTGLTPEEIESL